MKKGTIAWSQRKPWQHWPAAFWSHLPAPESPIIVVQVSDLHRPHETGMVPAQGIAT
jgi:hypothetical protein